MKKLFNTAILTSALIATLIASTAFAGRPTPKGDSMARFNAVMEQAPIGATILSVRQEATDPADMFDRRQFHFILEYKDSGEEFCRAHGYILKLKERDPVTAAATYNAEHDGLRRACVVSQ